MSSVSENAVIGWVLVFDSNSVRKANHGRGRNGMSHSLSFSVFV